MSAQRPRLASLRQPGRALWRTSAALLIASALLVSVHAPISAHPATQPLPTLRLNYYALNPPFWALDPAHVNGAGDVATISLVQANLVRILANDRPAPDLASHWTISKNHLVYTFTIRSNARFSNGHHVTAQDAAFSIERALSPSDQPVCPGCGTAAQGYLGLIRGADNYSSGKATTLTGVKVLNERTLQIIITKPVAYFLAQLAYPTADVLDPTLVAGHAATFKHNYLTNTCAANQGAGPFEFVCRDSSSNADSFYSGSKPMYTLVPNPYYYGPKPHIQIELPQYLQNEKHGEDDYRLYLAGKLDTASLPSVFLSQWRNRSKEYHAYPDSTISFLTPNVRLAPFDNVHCRLAVAYAIDRAALAASVERGTSRASYTVVPKGFLGFYDGKDNPHYRLSRARAELAQCPGRTISIELKYPATTGSPGASGRPVGLVGEAVSNMLIAAGMNVKPVPLSINDWLNVVGNGQTEDKTNTQIVQNSWLQDWPDPQDYCTNLLRSGSPYNVGGWTDPSYDHLVDRAELVLDSGKRAQLYIQAQHIALSQGAMISLTNELAPVLIKPYVHGLTGPGPYFTLIPKNLDWSNVSISPH